MICWPALWCITLSFPGRPALRKRGRAFPLGEKNEGREPIDMKNTKDRTKILTASTTHFEYDADGNLIIFARLLNLSKYPETARRTASDILEAFRSVTANGGNTVTVDVRFGHEPDYLIRPIDGLRKAHEALYNCSVVADATDIDLSALDTAGAAAAGTADAIGLEKINQQNVAGIPGSTRRVDGRPADILNVIAQADQDSGNGLAALVHRLNSVAKSQRQALLDTVGKKERPH